MTQQSPPTWNFSGLIYNPSFYSSAGNSNYLLRIGAPISSASNTTFQGTLTTNGISNNGNFLTSGSTAFINSNKVYMNTPVALYDLGETNSDYSTLKLSNSLYGTTSLTTGFENIIIGDNNMNDSNNASYYNISIGKNSLQLLSNGNQNVSIGYNSLSNLVDGIGNFSMGAYSGNNLGLGGITGCDGNFFAGNNCGGVVKSGSNNFFFGPNCASYGSLKTGIEGNVAQGYSSFANFDNDTKYNCAYGFNSLIGAGEYGWGNPLSGWYNSAFGNQSGYRCCNTSSCNTFVGANTTCADQTQSYSFSTALGFNSSIDASHTIYLGTSSETVKCWAMNIYGNANFNSNNITYANISNSSITDSCLSTNVMLLNNNNIFTKTTGNLIQSSSSTNYFYLDSGGTLGYINPSWGTGIGFIIQNNGYAKFKSLSNSYKYWEINGGNAGLLRYYNLGGTYSITLDGDVGAITASSFSGSGASLTSLNASNISSGIIADARLSTNIPLLNAQNTFATAITTNTNLIQVNRNSGGTGGYLYLNNSGNIGFSNGTSNLWTIDNTGALTVNNNITLNGALSITASNWNISSVGRASLQAITFNGTAGITCANLTGVTFDFKQNAPIMYGTNISNINASNISTGTIADARLSTNVPLLNTNQTITGTYTFSANPVFNNNSIPTSAITGYGLMTGLNIITTNSTLTQSNANTFISVGNGTSLTISLGPNANITDGSIFYLYANLTSFTLNPNGSTINPWGSSNLIVPQGQTLAIFKFSSIYYPIGGSFQSQSLTTTFPNQTTFSNPIIKIQSITSTLVNTNFDISSGTISAWYCWDGVNSISVTLPTPSATYDGISIGFQRVGLNPSVSKTLTSATSNILSAGSFTNLIITATGVNVNRIVCLKTNATTYNWYSG